MQDYCFVNVLDLLNDELKKGQRNRLFSFVCELYNKECILSYDIFRILDLLIEKIDEEQYQYIDSYCLILTDVYLKLQFDKKYDSYISYIKAIYQKIPKNLNETAETETETRDHFLILNLCKLLSS